MHHQLDIWPAAHNNAPYAQQPWENLSNEEQSEMITRLARLIAQCIRPHPEVQKQQRNDCDPQSPNKTPPQP
jgi:hypothetical protein